MSEQYKSSVLRTNVEDDSCPVCLFLNGSREVEHLMEVIRVLDVTLVDAETHVRNITAALINSRG